MAEEREPAAGEGVIRLAFTQAEPVTEPVADPPAASSGAGSRRQASPGPAGPDSGTDDAGGAGRGNDSGPVGYGELPPDCPVTPLGVMGEEYFYLDQARQLRVLKARDHQRLNVLSLFGADLERCRQWWPRKDQEGRVKGIREHDAAETLMMACSRRGLWDVMGRLRGPGAWRGERDELVYHVGDAVLVGSPPGVPWGDAPLNYRAPGAIGRMVYSAGADQPRPAEQPAPGGPDGPAARLLDLFATWHWQRPEVDPHLLLGHTCAAMIGGALDWRPVAWVTGAKGTGKSTLLSIVLALHEQAVLDSVNATEAGIRQALGHTTLPVVLDETESDEDNRTLNNLVKLARQSASGGTARRGGADHKASAFVARCCFLFSSILMPPLLPQDVSRMAILQLRKLPAGGRPPARDKAKLGELGRQLRRRLFDGWHRYHETFAAFREVLQASGHDARGADVFGTMLALASLALDDHLPDVETLQMWSERLAASGLAEVGQIVEDWQSCVLRLVTSPADAFRGGQKQTLGYWIAWAADRFKGEDLPDMETPAAANLLLQTFGLKVRVDNQGRDNQRAWLAVSGTHQGLARIFEGTHWAQRSGSSSPVNQSLMSVPGAYAGNVRLKGMNCKCIWLPLDVVMPDGDDSTAEAAHAGQAVDT